MLQQIKTKKTARNLEKKLEKHLFYHLIKTKLFTWSSCGKRLLMYSKFVHQFVLQGSADGISTGQNGPSPKYFIKQANTINTIIYNGVSLKEYTLRGIRLMMFNATFNNISAISWWSVLLVEETGENNRPVASHSQTLSHNVVSSTPRHERNSSSQP
jgi:hypothetical protein